MTTTRCRKREEAFPDPTLNLDHGHTPRKKVGPGGLLFVAALMFLVFMAEGLGATASSPASATRWPDRSEEGAPPTAAQEAAGVRTETLYSSTVANIRSGPGTEYPVVGQLQKGQRVLVPVERDSWTHVFEASGSNRRLGFVASRLLSKSAPSAALPPDTPWAGTYVGRTPAYYVKDRQGRDLVIRGRKVRIPRANWTLTLRPDRTARVRHAVAGEDVHYYSGTCTVKSTEEGFAVDCTFRIEPPHRDPDSRPRYSYTIDAQGQAARCAPDASGQPSFLLVRQPGDTRTEGADEGSPTVTAASETGPDPGSVPDTLDRSGLGVGFGPEQFALIPAGTFRMGSDGGHPDERPAHRVNITQPFYVQKTPVTQGQWKAVMGSNPSQSRFSDCGDTCPVEWVSWNDIQRFLTRLNAMDPGKNYRLPTEAEWEYAARAGTTGHFGGTGVLDEMGWYQDNSGFRIHPVARKQPNHWGLFDMHGNVLEWVQDRYSATHYQYRVDNGLVDDPSGPETGQYRVARGGSSRLVAGGALSALRHRHSPTYEGLDLGFRLAKTPGKRAPPALGVGFGPEQFALIPAGTFQMGSDDGRPDERPVHTVNITQPFYMQKTPVTQGQWRAVMGTNPSHFSDCGDTCPVEQVSWGEAQRFLEQLNTIYPGMNYRLPTEAEWEYAARAGTTGDYGGTGVLDEMGWYGGNSGSTTHPVAQKQPNHWGLFDMHGNVWEWVQDWYSTTYYQYCVDNGIVNDPPGPATRSFRVLRGGSWYINAINARSACRHNSNPSYRYSFNGFRLARTQ